MVEIKIFRWKKFPQISFLFFLCLSLATFFWAKEAFTDISQDANKAVRLKIDGHIFENELVGQNAPAGQVFLVIETSWENIHPKQKVEKERIDGKTDRTMGVGGLAGRKQSKKTEYVEMDVAYQVKKLYDHVYLLGDGLAYSLHRVTENIPGGHRLQEPFTIPKQGEIRNVKLTYLIPENKKNLGIQMFDYQYGHINLPVQGNLHKARGSGEPSGKILGQIKTELVEFATHALAFQKDYTGKNAPEGWQYAVVQLSGKSLSGNNVRDIVQLKPAENTWVTTDGGYLFYSSASSTAANGFIRFTPEIYQFQEVAFLVPETSENFMLGIRAGNEVLNLELTKKSPESLPKPKITHTDGDVMEVMVFGTRRENGMLILDLGIRSLVDHSGLEIQMDRQFFLQTAVGEAVVNKTATSTLAHHPPQPFIVPPGTSVRFELAFDAGGAPTALRFRGYRSEGKLEL